MNNIDVGAHHENQQEHYEWCKSNLQMFKLTNSDMNSHYLTALDKKQKKRSNWWDRFNFYEFKSKYCDVILLLLIYSEQ